MQKRYTLILFLVILITGMKAQDPLYDELADRIDILVAKDGSGDFTSVQEALSAVPRSSAKRTIIYVRNGIYEEKLSGRANNFTLIGQNVDSVIITSNPTHGGPNTGATVKLTSTDFIILNLTLENSYGVGNQAEALATSQDGQQFAHCRFVGFQDTYFAEGRRQLIKDCLIIGAVDYIFGGSATVFDNCQIHNLRDRSWITAASTSNSQRFGYVFQNCWVTGKYGVKDVYFGRPWNNYPKVLFRECYLSDIMSLQGWDNTWYPPENVGNLSFFEYKNYGPGAEDLSNRIDYSRQITDEEAASYVMDSVFSVSNNASFRTDWAPTLEEDTFYLMVNKHFPAFLSDEVTQVGLSGLTVNGSNVGFDPNAEMIDIDLPSGTTEWPVLEATPEAPEMIVKITYPNEIPGTGLLVVSSKYEAMHKAYTLNFKNDQQIVFELPKSIPSISLSQNITECVTAVDNNMENAGVSVYPNPTSGVFTINLNANVSGNVTVVVHNMLGQKVYEKSNTASALQMNNQVDLTGMKSGQYLVKVITPDSHYSTKIMLK